MEGNSRGLESADEVLRRRAERVVPGGMWGHMNVARLPAGYPQYFRSARGCRLIDADGRSYIDLMCAYGPIILGYGDEDVEAATAAQRRLGDVMTGPSEVQVELAELFVATVPHADWAMFAKNGTDATTSCVTIARALSGKRKILVARARTTAPSRGARPRWRASPSRTALTSSTSTTMMRRVSSGPLTKPATTLRQFW